MNKYKMKQPYDEQSLAKLNFYFDRTRSDEETKKYMRKFTVYKYSDSILLEAWFCLDYKTGDVTVDVMDVYSGRYGKYAKWYLSEYGDYEPLLNGINEKIAKEMKKCGIVERNKNENQD